ncbi:hypothetical protein TOPH_08550 [Tolypocladium ophioglossoides CBS 100239]|uniref:Uncharacterized protein n=1 Tax=Tolypocladium ophioglossoides (strain CBS 100239) TaxID=1163406 RepID=A0A0L0MYB6_TOLOC|nr:hypothetical protein TOPH_08550 [Tolypocladium ophioglossoides CBS 100239]
MPNLPQARCRTIEVDGDFLPPPATKLVVTQYLEASQEPPFWAWIVVGAFLDRHDQVIWSTEVFAAHLDIQFESDDEETQTDVNGDDDVSDSSSAITAIRDSANLLCGITEPLLPQPAHVLGSDTSRSSPSPLNAGSTPGNLFLEFAVLVAVILTRSSLGLVQIAVNIMSGGWNPITGRDERGQRPPFAPYGAPVPSQGQPYVHHQGGPGYNFGTVPQYGPWANMTYGMYNIAGQSWPPAAAYPTLPLQAPAGGFYTPQTFSCQPNGTGNILPRQPQPWPAIDPKMPAAQMTNSSGGVGCEPGYNYFFPAEHTKVHAFRTDIPPWQLPATTQIPFLASHIPCNTTLAELLKGYGCTNAAAKKNRVFEIMSGGGGKWYKGLEINGGDKETMKKTIGDIGWDATRTGLPGQKPVVCLWFCQS